MMTPFLTDLEYVLHLVRSLAQQAEENLPAAVRHRHAILANHDPAAWRSTGLAFPGTPWLVEVQVLTEVISRLEGLVADQKRVDRPPVLTLGRMRRSS